MNRFVNRALYRALFSSLSTTLCAAGSIFLAAGVIQASAQIMDLTYLVQWEESLIFTLIGITTLISGLVSLWMYTRVTRKGIHE